MNDSSDKVFGNDQESDEAAFKQNSAAKEALEELRSLLFGFESSKLDQLHQKLDNPNISVEEIGRVLPEAIANSSLRDKRLVEAILSTLEEAIQLSVERNPNILSDAIYPIIGPASRKAIASALDESMQTFNQVLENSISPQSFIWRFEALRTGKSFAELILLNTLIYRVEQVFLIHKDTGLLLQNLVAKNVKIQDADLVSAMLTAMESFVQDSFKVQPEDALEVIQFGELNLWIEQGPQAILAAAIRGRASQELRLVLQETLEKIHLYHNQDLKSFQGDATIFIDCKPLLENCLQARYKPKKHKIAPVTWFVLGMTVLGLGSWTYLGIRDRLRWQSFITQLQAEPGIVLTTAEKRQGKYFIRGLRDPLAADPTQLMQTAKINPQQVISHWEPYLSFSGEFIAARAKNLLQPPKTVSLLVDANRVLSATGSAPRDWIVETRKIARAIPGIAKFQDNLIETEILKLKAKIEAKKIRFISGIKIESSQISELENLIQTVKKLNATAKKFGKTVKIEIRGHTDREGEEQANILMSQARADAVLSRFVAQGIDRKILSTRGMGTKESLRKETTELDKALNRRVSFRVILTDAVER